MLKKMIKMKAIALTAKPADPIQNGPFGTFFRPVKRWEPMARAYDMVVRMMKDPTKSVNAVLLPSWMAPKAVHRMAQRTVAGTGQLSRSSTSEKNPEKGVALSRAKAHQIRPTVRKVPRTQIMIDKKIMRRRPKVAPLFPVA